MLFCAYEIRVVAHLGKGRTEEVFRLVEDEIDPPHLGLALAGEAVLTGDVTQDRRGLAQLDLAVDEVGQVGPVEPERGLDTLPLGAILEVTLFVVGASERQQQANGLTQLLTSQDNN